MYSPYGYQEKENNKDKFNYSQVRSASAVINNNYTHTSPYNNFNNNQLYNNSPTYNNTISPSYRNTHSHLKESTSTHPFTQAKSEQNLQILKLQSKALQQLRKLQHQKFQISTLTEETEKLMRLCDQQKSYIKSVNVEMMRQQYEQELKYLSQERNKLLEMIALMKKQKQAQNDLNKEKINSARMDNLLLSQKIEQALLKKQEMLKVKYENGLLKSNYQEKIAEQEGKLDQLRHVDRKVAISLKQIQTLRRQYLQLQSS